MLAFDTAYYEKPGFIRSFCRNFDNIRIIPEFLGLDEVDPMFFEVSLTFSLVELEHIHGIENIPFLICMQVFLVIFFYRDKTRYSYDGCGEENTGVRSKY